MTAWEKNWGLFSYVTYVWWNARWGMSNIHLRKYQSIHHIYNAVHHNQAWAIHECIMCIGLWNVLYMLYESCVFHLSNDSVVWPSCCTGLCVKKARLTSQLTKTLESTSIRNRSDVKMSDRCLIDVDPIVPVFWEVMGILQWDKIHRYDAVLLQVA